jgi:NCAIR mutase (PurE)-related protein
MFLAFFVGDYGVPSGSQAAIISCRQQDVAPGKGTVVVAAAGTSDFPSPRRRRAPPN